MLTLQVRRFVISGLLATGIHVAVASTLIEHWRLQPAYANAIAFAMATAVSYVINTVWSFSGVLGGVTLIRFVLVQLLGVCLAAAVSGTADLIDLHYLIGIVCVPLFVTPVTYTLHKIWTYRDNSRPRAMGT